jgi:hypothetical protein
MVKRGRATKDLVPIASATIAPGQKHGPSSAQVALDARIAAADTKALPVLVEQRRELIEQDLTALEARDRIDAARHRRSIATLRALQTPAYFTCAMAAGVYLIEAGFAREGSFLLAGALSMTAAWKFVKRWIEGGRDGDR